MGMNSFVDKNVPRLIIWRCNDRGWQKDICQCCASTQTAGRDAVASVFELAPDIRFSFSPRCTRVAEDKSCAVVRGVSVRRKYGSLSLFVVRHAKTREMHAPFVLSRSSHLHGSARVTEVFHRCRLPPFSFRSVCSIFGLFVWMDGFGLLMKLLNKN